MKQFAFALAAVTLLAFGASASADSTMKPIIVTPDSVKWMPGTGQIPATVGVAVLEGDPSKSGPFTMRLNIPDGTKFAVHYHDDTERLTVISGTFMAGVGTTFDETKMVALPAGSYCVLPAGLRHYAMAKGQTVVQVSGNGPFAMKFDSM
ncbi:MAG TPA: cupin domain-containing protein [Candidatus Eremiobacteraceae bacterium]|jgi:quercetin dioxygenase-like cupin family protein